MTETPTISVPKPKLEGLTRGYYKYAHDRFAAARKVDRPPITGTQWFTIDEGQFKMVQNYIENLYSETKGIKPPEGYNKDDINVREDMIITPEDLNVSNWREFEKHLEMMEHTIDKLYAFDDFKKMFQINKDSAHPEYASKYFPMALARLHDATRAVYNRKIPTWIVDAADNTLLGWLNIPDVHKYMHNIDWMLGTKPPPDPKTEPFPYIMKALDTLCKPGRHPAHFPEEYREWIKRYTTGDVKQFPMKIPYREKISDNPPTYKTSEKIVTAEEYVRRDLEYTAVGVQKLKEIVGQEGYIQLLNEIYHEDQGKFDPKAVDIDFSYDHIVGNRLNGNEYTA